MNIDELKPCPFCGNNKRLVEVVTRQGGHSICCDWCGGTTDSEDSTEEAKNAWNRRSDNTSCRKQRNLTPCDCCKFNPPSIGNGKPCSVCPAQAKMKGGEG